MAIININHIVSRQGGGAPYYLNGATSAYGYTIGTTEYIFVASLVDDSLTAWDVSTPSNPTVAATISGTGPPNYLNGASDVIIATIGGTEYAFVASRADAAMVVFDVSGVGGGTITQVGVISGAGPPNYLSDARCIEYAVIGGTEYIFVGGRADDALVIIDVSTPNSPSLAGVLTGVGAPNFLQNPVSVHVATVGGTEYAFVAANGDSSLTIIDVSTPGSPSFVGNISGTGPPNYLDIFDVDVITIGGTEYAVTVSFGGDAVSIFDVSTPSSPSHIASLVGTGGGSPYWLGSPLSVRTIVVDSIEYAFICSWLDGAFTVIDISDPNNPTHVDSIQGYNSPYWLGGAYRHYYMNIGSSLYAFVAAEAVDALAVLGFDTSSSSSASSSSSSSSYSSSSSFSSSSSSSSGPAPGQRRPTVAVSRGNVVLVYVENGYLTKRIFPYGATAWEDPMWMVRGYHPDIVDQWGYLFLTWGWLDELWYATSIDGGRNFTAPQLLSTYVSGRLPSDDVLPDGYIGVAYVGQEYSSSLSFSSSSGSFSSSSFSSSSSSFSSSSFSSSSFSSFSSSSYSSFSSFSSSSYSSSSSASSFSSSSYSSSSSASSFSSSSYSSFSSSSLSSFSSSSLSSFSSFSSSSG